MLPHFVSGKTLLACSADAKTEAKLRSTVAMLPSHQLQCVAMCYAVGLLMQHPDNQEEALMQLEVHVLEMKVLLLQSQARLAMTAPSTLDDSCL